MKHRSKVRVFDYLCNEEYQNVISQSFRMTLDFESVTEKLPL